MIFVVLKLLISIAVKTGNLYDLTSSILNHTALQFRYAFSLSDCANNKTSSTFSNGFESFSGSSGSPVKPTKNMVFAHLKSNNPNYSRNKLTGVQQNDNQEYQYSPKH
jgi:hypothetical protein